MNSWQCVWEQNPYPIKRNLGSLRFFMFNPKNKVKKLLRKQIYASKFVSKVQQIRIHKSRVIFIKISAKFLIENPNKKTVYGRNAESEKCVFLANFFSTISKNFMSHPIYQNLIILLMYFLVSADMWANKS